MGKSSAAKHFLHPLAVRAGRVERRERLGLELDPGRLGLARIGGERERAFARVVAERLS